ncbi:DNA-binding protein [Pseudomonas sp.]|uniref:DNA-binding protein n=1 Tax=Pseudomonas sp. TaxID=306 RepID=UPI003CC52117
MEGIDINLGDQPPPPPPPPLMPWREFADWIRMDHDIVRGWIRRGYIPTVKLGKHMMINVALLLERLRDEDDF